MLVIIYLIVIDEIYKLVSIYIVNIHLFPEETEEGVSGILRGRWVGQGGEGGTHHGSHVSTYYYCYCYCIEITLLYHTACFVLFETNIVQVVFVFRMYQRTLWCHASPW